MAQKVLSGHRVKVARFDVATGRSTVVGVFNDVTYSGAYGAQAVFILGRSSAAALQYTHAEPISFTLRAWHVLDHGPFVDGMLPRLQELLDNNYVRLTLMDRQLEKDGKDATIGEIADAITTTFNTGVGIKQLKEWTVTGMGLLIRDESAKNAEAAGATNLP